MNSNPYDAKNHHAEYSLYLYNGQKGFVSGQTDARSRMLLFRHIFRHHTIIGANYNPEEMFASCVPL